MSQKERPSWLNKTSSILQKREEEERAKKTKEQEEQKMKALKRLEQIDSWQEIAATTSEQLNRWRKLELHRILVDLSNSVFHKSVIVEVFLKDKDGNEIGCPKQIPQILEEPDGPFEITAEHFHDWSDTKYEPGDIESLYFYGAVRGKDWNSGSSSGCPRDNEMGGNNGYYSDHDYFSITMTCKDITIHRYAREGQLIQLTDSLESSQIEQVIDEYLSSTLSPNT